MVGATFQLCSFAASGPGSGLANRSTKTAYVPGSVTVTDSSAVPLALCPTGVRLPEASTE